MRLGFAAAADETAARRLRLLLATPASAMSTVLETLEARYGSAAEYLISGGVAAESLERLRGRLLVAP